jgi:hypothetical protein
MTTHTESALSLPRRGSIPAGTAQLCCVQPPFDLTLPARNALHGEPADVVSPHSGRLDSHRAPRFRNSP